MNQDLIVSNIVPGEYDDVANAVHPQGTACVHQAGNAAQRSRHRTRLARWKR